MNFLASGPASLKHPLDQLLERANLDISNERIITDAKSWYERLKVTFRDLNSQQLAAVCLQLSSKRNGQALDNSGYLQTKSGLARKDWQRAVNKVSTALAEFGDKHASADVTVDQLVVKFGGTHVKGYAKAVVEEYVAAKRISKESLKRNQSILNAAAYFLCSYVANQKVNKQSLIALVETQSTTFNKVCEDMRERAPETLAEVGAKYGKGKKDKDGNIVRTPTSDRRNVYEFQTSDNEDQNEASTPTLSSRLRVSRSNSASPNLNSGTPSRQSQNTSNSSLLLSSSKKVRNMFKSSPPALKNLPTSPSAASRHNTAPNTPSNLRHSKNYPQDDDDEAEEDEEEQVHDTRNLDVNGNVIPTLKPSVARGIGGRTSTPRWASKLKSLNSEAEADVEEAEKRWGDQEGVDEDEIAKRRRQRKLNAIIGAQAMINVDDDAGKSARFARYEAWKTRTIQRLQEEIRAEEEAEAEQEAEEEAEEEVEEEEASEVFRDGEAPERLGGMVGIEEDMEEDDDVQEATREEDDQMHVDDHNEGDGGFHDPQYDELGIDAEMVDACAYVHASPEKAPVLKEVVMQTEVDVEEDEEEFTLAMDTTEEVPRH
ncbi:hypothetical protein HDV05_001943 [Chytridiales sp. JEL 0842]|nr:hypothetical protein HDV05_001943 [Chytridiales sp. JEL 0842]